MGLHTASSVLAATPERLCILRLSAIGDCCHVVPVVRTLQRVWPHTALTWIIGRAEAALVGDLPGVEFIIVDKRDRRARAKLRQQLAGRRFDVLLHMQAALRASLLSRAVNAPLRVGFDRARARDFQWLFSNRRIPARPREHVLDGLFGFIEALGVHERDLRWDIPIPDAARQRAAQWLPEGPPIVAINPCSSDRRLNYRNWPQERYAAVADWAMEQGLRVVLTGGPAAAERAFAAGVVEKMRQPPLDLVGHTSLKELLAVLDRSTVLIAPDTGPAHMATTVGTPVIGLYASSNPERTGPYLAREWTLNRYPEAVRAFLGKAVEEVAWGQRVRDPAAMSLISVDDVIQRLRAASAISRGISP